MKKIFFLLFLWAGAAPALFAQAKDTWTCGTVYGIEFHHNHQDTIALIHANVMWAGTTLGTVSDDVGFFKLDLSPASKKLVAGYVGYESDTLQVEPGMHGLAFYLKPDDRHEEMIIEGKKPHTLHLHEAEVNTQSITRQGLRTLACCNLAESFENSLSVDVEQSDAVSGAKRIKMLGLAGFYTQILVEKNPLMRGLISPFGLEYIPGFWIDAIDISKGTASVATGYESITGQINVELTKPELGRPLALNAFQNSMGRSELTLSAARKVTPKLSTMLLSYGSYNRQRWDEDSDTFLDMPLVSHLSLLNRWKYSGDGRDGQIGFKILRDTRDGGQTAFDFGRPRAANSGYGSRNRIGRYEFFAKAGSAFSNGRSLGLILSGFHHKQDSFWGAKNYADDENSLYANLIFEQKGARHRFSSGLSYLLDERDEIYQTVLFRTRERVPGLFAEYTYKPHERLSAMAGFRYDRHNLYGPFYTPRLHLKYQADALTALRLSAGKGYRVPHLFMDNPAMLASSREVIFAEPLAAEEAWNAGLQLTRDFSLGVDRPGTLAFDFYRTEFLQQTVVDLDRDPRTIVLYNLDGRSFANSAQLEVTATAVRGLDLTAAWRINDVRMTYAGELNELPLNPRHKGVLVLSWTPPAGKWQFDVTTQYNGATRLPETALNPEPYRMGSSSPAYAQLFAQVTRKMGKMDLYLGGENLTGFRQERPILAWEDPFSPWFDSSLVWGPTAGRRFYVGLRVNG